MDDPIIPFELKRMFIGDHPALFYLEIVVRTALMYVYTLALIRWIGGRSVAQLSMVDMLLVISLGSAVGDAPFYADVPLLAAMLVILVIVAINKAIDKLIERSDRVKVVIDGQSVAMARHGRLLAQGLAVRDLRYAFGSRRATCSSASRSAPGSPTIANPTGPSSIDRAAAIDKPAKRGAR